MSVLTSRRETLAADAGHKIIFYVGSVSLLWSASHSYSMLFQYSNISPKAP